MTEILSFIVNVGAALLMGTAIGLERQIRQHTAGLRTNALVCLGAALFVSLSRLVDHEASPSRIAAQVASGVGFLGGGVIFREGVNVRGMNTAATLWCSAAVGTLAGFGLLAQGVVGTAAVLLVHVALRPVVRLVELKTKTAVEVETVYRLRVTCRQREEGVVRTVIMRHVNSQPSMTVQGVSIQDTGPPETVALVAEIYSSERNDRFMNEMASRLGIEPGVSAVSWERAR